MSANEQEPDLEPTLKESILAFLRQQEEGEADSAQEGPVICKEMPLPDDLEPHLAAAKAGLLQLKPVLTKGISGEVIRSLTPFAAQLGASVMAYNFGLGVMQLVGMGMRVSCNSRLLGPCLGFMGVGVASALAGQASRRVRRGLASGRTLRAELTAEPLLQGWQLEEVLLDALVGVSAFKLLGGRFRSVMPSDLRYPGAFAKGSMPTTRSVKDDSTAYLSYGPNRDHLTKMLLKDGCHSCGKRGGGLCADHMPPNTMYKQAKLAAEHLNKEKQSQRVVLRKMLAKLPTGIRNRAEELAIKHTDSMPQQHFYPHCTSCSNKQGQHLGNRGRGPLVLHRLGVPPGPVPGIMAGFRFLTTLKGLPPNSGSGSAPPHGKAASKRQQQDTASAIAIFAHASARRGPFQASLPCPPTLLVGYDSEEEEQQQIQAAAKQPTLMLNVSENGSSTGGNLWAYAVRIMPEDYSDESAWPSSHLDRAVQQQHKLPALTHTELQHLSQHAKASPLQLPQLTSDQWYDVARSDATTPRGTNKHTNPTLLCHVADQNLHRAHPACPPQLENPLPYQIPDDQLSDQLQQSQHEGQGVFGDSCNSLAASVCKPRHALSPALQAVLADLLKSCSSADVADVQQQQKEADLQQQQHWQQRLTATQQQQVIMQLMQQQQQQQVKQPHEPHEPVAIQMLQEQTVRSSAGSKRARDPSDEFGTRFDPPPFDPPLQQHMPRPTNISLHTNSSNSSTISPRSMPLHALVQAQSQRLQQQWQHDQAIHHWRLHQ